MPNVDFLMAGPQGVPEPEPASRSMPDWWKALSTRTEAPNKDGKPGGSARRCAPLTDAIRAGYVIPFPWNMYARASEGKLSLTLAPLDADDPCRDYQQIEMHHHEQVGDWPFGQPIKINVPIAARVPDGYSMLAVPPLNRDPFPLVPVAGIVEFDTYPDMVNFPCFWDHAKFPEWDGPVPFAEPFAQLIPFRREDWTMSVTHEAEPEWLNEWWRWRARVGIRVDAYRKWYHRVKRWR